ncbi:hypothetical protein [Mycetocola miduiensis]|uniref:Uncharacterized protein n=1 Tax=Mycetocola miduiensis TaxID=995034 RepID=A0A1I5AFR4_9MICO|nr:hypothetical protein [Mycetocola miduiensis]SFN61293.1 hypothetical protein SAMN05216219_1427 [Mycetocola miduiensis]
MASEIQPTPIETEFIAAVQSGPLTQVEVIEATDGAGLVVTAVAVDPETGGDVPVGIALDPDGAAFVVTIAREEIIIPLDESSEQASSSKDSRHIEPLRKLHELATGLEQEAKGKARQLAERLRRKRDS